MNSLFFALNALAVRWLEPRLNERILFLEAQIRMLRNRLDSARIIATPEERAELLRIGALLDHEVRDLIHVVKPDTYRRWRQEQARGRIPKFVGRPAISEEVRELVKRFAIENVRWGYKRIVGELKKLGHFICVSTVKDILKDEVIPPTPVKAGRKFPMPWNLFIHANMDSLIACDFFTIPIHSLYGTTHAYILIFVHLGSRKVYASPATYHPKEDWVIQQSRNAAMWMDEQGLKARWIIHDRDTKFSLRFREFWKSESVKSVRTPIRSPKANAFAESFIGKIKQECLDYYFFLSMRQLDYVVRVWLEHYNTVRPHQGKDKDNNVLEVDFKPQLVGKVRCREKLGGVIKEYYRDAA